MYIILLLVIYIFPIELSALELNAYVYYVSQSYEYDYACLLLPDFPQHQSGLSPNFVTYGLGFRFIMHYYQFSCWMPIQVSGVKHKH